jgi:hypothetical protein
MCKGRAQLPATVEGGLDVGRGASLDKAPLQNEYPTVGSYRHLLILHKLGARYGRGLAAAHVLKP